MEIIGHEFVVRNVHILPPTGNQFTQDEDFEIKIFINNVVGRYKKFQKVLIHGGYRSIRGLYRPAHRCLNGSVLENVNLDT